jgi:hypothetical protein
MLLAFINVWPSMTFGPSDATAAAPSSVLNDLRVSIGTSVEKSKLLTDSRARFNRRSAIDHVPELFLDGS